jgi:iron complex outermembrane receptor protein
MIKLHRALPHSVSALALVAATSFLASGAQAQDASANATETVTVTGTSIRGISPVGSNLMTMTPEDIQATGAPDIQGVLADNPALMAFGTGSQGQQATGASSQAYQPSIHSLGSSGANTTLVLVDGHRFALSGTNHDEPDPDLIPINMVQRVDVLAEGASSIYGSDAIAGVVNLITRKAFDGVELSGQATAYPDKLDTQAGILIGKAYNSGWVEAAYSYVHESTLLDTKRPWTSPAAVIGEGGTNPGNFSCSPATIQPNGTGNIFTSATSGAQLANSTANSPCSQWQYGALIPETVRSNGMIKWEQNLGSQVTVDTELNYFVRSSYAPTSRGTLTATAFDTGPQANPFYETPAGYTGTATKETIRWDGDQLLGPGAYDANTDENFFGDMNIEYRPNDNWAIDLLALEGRDTSTGYSQGQINSSVATLGLNGTITTSGSTTTPLANSNGQILFNEFPLTTATALDVWNPAATNLTSAAVIGQLEDNYAKRIYTDTDTQVRLQANGTLFNLPAGQVKVALGTEMNRWLLDEEQVQSNGGGPASVSSNFQQYQLPRNVYSGFGEIIVPIISPDAGIPLMQKFTMDFSGRYDHYSDFGPTTNPKGSFDWQVYSDLKLRGNYSTAFVAPSIDEVGNAQGQSTLQTYGAPGSLGNVNLPVSLYPQLPQMGISGCTAASTTCNVSSLTGLTVTTANHGMQPDKGRTWSIGGDFAPSFLPGFDATTTLWWAHLKGAVQAAQVLFVGINPAISYLLQLYPTGATAAQIAAATKGIYGTSSVAPGVSFIFNSENSDWVNLEEQGVDFNVNYTYDTNGFGSFLISDAGSIIMNAHQCFGPGGACISPAYSITNTIGTNNTFSTIADQQRFTLGWHMSNYGAVLNMNYIGSYHNWGSGTLTPVHDNTLGQPTGGGDVVAAEEIFDLHLSYIFDEQYLGTNDILALTVTNLFNTRPSFVNTSTGVNQSQNSPGGSVLERGITLALTAKL